MRLPTCTSTGLGDFMLMRSSHQCNGRLRRFMGTVNTRGSCTNRKTALRGGLSEIQIVCLIRRRPSRPKPPMPVAKRGRSWSTPLKDMLPKKNITLRHLMCRQSPVCFVQFQLGQRFCLNAASESLQISPASVQSDRSRWLSITKYIAIDLCLYSSVWGLGS
jgi:hypothetical protein